MAPEAENLQSSNLNPNTGARLEAKPLQFPKLNEEELTSSHHACPSALADCGINGITVRAQQCCVSAFLCKTVRHLCNLLAALPFPMTGFALQTVRLHTLLERCMAHLLSGVA